MADERREPEDGQRFPSCGMEDGRRHRPQGRRSVEGVDAVAVRRADLDRRGRGQLQEGPHLHHRGRRPRAASGHLGARRVRRGRVRPVLPGVDARTAHLHQGGHRGRGQADRLMRRPVAPERRTRIGRVPHLDWQRQARGVRQQDQGHHPHGLRLPPRRQPHRAPRTK